MVSQTLACEASRLSLVGGRCTHVLRLAIHLDPVLRLLNLGAVELAWCALELACLCATSYLGEHSSLLGEFPAHHGTHLECLCRTGPSQPLSRPSPARGVC